MNRRVSPRAVFSKMRLLMLIALLVLILNTIILFSCRNRKSLPPEHIFINDSNDYPSEILTHSLDHSFRVFLKGETLFYDDIIDNSKQWRGRNTSEHRGCIVIPFRESFDEYNNGKGRGEQLIMFKRYIKQFLRYQQIPYTLIIAEQEQGLLFNKATVCNGGAFISYDICDYLVFHDVDLLPHSMSNKYDYPDHPVHMAINWGQEKVEFNDHAGGVVKISMEQFLDVGGYSNGYWGWGLEDNDFYQRIIASPHKLEKLNARVGKYSKLEHPRSDYGIWGDSKQFNQTQYYFHMSSMGNVDFQAEGIRSANLTIVDIIEDSLECRHYIFKPNNQLNLLHSGIYDFQ